MKLLLINQHYPPDSGATGRLVAQLAEALVQGGHEVSVLTGRPTYEEAQESFAPIREVRNGVHVHRVPLLPRWKNRWGRAFHYLSFAVSMLIGGIFRSRPDVILASSATPMFGGVAAVALARAKRCPLAYVVQDVYPEIAVALGAMRGGTVQRIAQYLEAFAWRRASKLVLIGDEFREVAMQRGVREERIVTIPNWADCEEVRPLDISAFRREMGFSDDEFVVEYAGNFGQSQDLEAVLEAARLVERDAVSPVRFLLVGDGSRSHEVRRMASPRTNVRICSYQPEERLGDVLAAADLALVPLREGLSRYCVPSKVYSILASGRAVGASIDSESEVARLIEEGECGFRVDPKDPAAMAREILRLAGDRESVRAMGRRGRDLGEREGSLSRALIQYEDLFVGLSERGSGVKEPELLSDE